MWIGRRRRAFSLKKAERVAHSTVFLLPLNKKILTHGFNNNQIGAYQVDSRRAKRAADRALKASFQAAAGIGKLSGNGLPTANCLLLTVKDTGTGIPQKQLPYIFDRFYQADDSATRHAEGTGIGLTLTKELVKLLGGEISVESESGKGSTFSISLPVSRKAPSAQDLAISPDGNAGLPIAMGIAVASAVSAPEWMPGTNGQPQGAPLLL